MPAKIHPAVRERARELWEKEGYSPNDIVKHLPSDLLDGKIQVPGVHMDNVVVPNHRSVINIWAKEEGWSPHWREAKKKVNQKIDRDIAEGVPFAISGIKDPIWHLAIVEAQRYIAGLKLPSVAPLERTKEGRSNFRLFLDGYDLGNSDQELTAAAMDHVSQMLRPGQRVLLRLQPIIQNELKRVRKRTREFHQWFESCDNAPVPTDLFPSIEELTKNASELWEERLKGKGVEEN